MASNNNGGSSTDYIVVGAAFAVIGLERIFSYFSTSSPPPTPPPPSKRLGVVCKHLEEIYRDFHKDHEQDSSSIVAFQKYCTLFEKGESNKTIVNGKASSMPNPLHFILQSYDGCTCKAYGDHRIINTCGKRYIEMTRELFDADKRRNRE